MDEQRLRDRRAFIKFSAALAGTAVLASCGKIFPAGEDPPKASPTILPTHGDQPTLTPFEPATHTPESTMDSTGRVVLVKTDDRVDGIRRALNLWDHNPVAGKKLFLKPNFNSADPFPGSSHIETLQTLVESLHAMGAEHITIGDRSGMGDTDTVMRAKGVFTLADELNLSALVFDELGADAWELLQPQDSHWTYGYALPTVVLSADGVVQTCCLKTHRYGGHFTLSLKNSVGLAAKRIPGSGHDFMTELHNSPHQRRMIAEINLAYEPDLVLLDGVEAFVDGGPARGTKVTPGVILLGADRVALDAVGVAILRYFGTTREVSQGALFEQEQIARAVELGLGVRDPEGIEFVTEDGKSAEFAEHIREYLFS